MNNILLTPYFFCPNPDCMYHDEDQARKPGWYRRKGKHVTSAFGRVQRYQCLHCMRSFSDQTFTLNYYLKIDTNFKAFSYMLNSASSYNFIARQTNMSSDSVRLRSDRLGRNGLFIMASVLEEHFFREHLVADGFESYSYSKYFPLVANILVGASSEFLYYLNICHQKRKGAMTDRQKEQIEIVYKDKSFNDSKLTVRFQELITFLIQHHPGGTLRLDTDEHPTYASIIKSTNERTGKDTSIYHRRTSSKLYRDKNNPLFPVNYIDRQFRKDLPEHRRKTICTARNDNNLCLRFWHYTATHNFFKPHRITGNAQQKQHYHYEFAGIEHIKVEPKKSLFFTYRFFKSKVTLEKQMDAVWKQEVASPHYQGKNKVPKFCVAEKTGLKHAA